MQIREVAQQKLNKKVFVIPMLIFPDMEHEAAIEARAADAKVKTIFGTKNLMERIVGAFYDEEIYHPPSAYLVEQIAETLLPYLADDGDDTFPDLCNGVRGPKPQDPPAAGGAKPERADQVDLADRQPVIGHADVVNVFNGPTTIYQEAVPPTGGGVSWETPPEQADSAGGEAD